MYAIIKDNRVIGTADFEPCPDDLKTRNEYSVDCETGIEIGYIYENNNFIKPQPIVPTKELLLKNIRIQRDYLLSASDPWTLSDYPIPQGVNREQWKDKILAYRQALRDFPDTCDIENPQYPKL